MGSAEETHQAKEPHLADWGWTLGFSWGFWKQDFLIGRDPSRPSLSGTAANCRGSQPSSMPPAKSMVLLLASLSCAGALVLPHHRHAPGRVVELGTRAGHAAMQHSKGWDDFGKPPFNFYKVSLC